MKLQTKPKARLLLASLCAAACGAPIAHAARIAPAAPAPTVKPSALFTDHMVLQTGRAVPIWGTAAPGEKVTIKLEGQTKSALTAADGKWRIDLAKLKPGGPFQMTILGSLGKQAAPPLVVQDVLVGEVWLGSGQSNMVFNISNVGHRPYGILDEQKEIAAANFPQVRMFTVKDTKSLTPQDDFAGEWKVCSPQTVPDFSAVGYLFARNLNQALKLPVGILLSAYGASTAEAWIPREALAADPKLKPILEGFDTREAAYKEHPEPPAAAMPPPAPPAPVPPTPANDASANPATPPAAPRAARRAAGSRDPVQDQHQPTVLYNGMIQPILPYAIRGVLWYQGESILGNPDIPMYGHIMETLVTEWRKRWNEGNFPFYAVQLAALKNNSNNPRVREQQAEILSLPNTGLAVTIDIGDPTNVHPKNKEPLGDRLSRIALANVYGRTMEYSGPLYTSMNVEGAAMRIHFTHAAGLTAKDGPLKWFQIAGPDGKYVDAQATIDGDSVLLRSPDITSPVSARYAWDDYPEGANLYNAANLPAAPFRTDKPDR